MQADHDSVMLASHRVSECTICDRCRQSDAGRRYLVNHLIGDAHTSGMFAQATFSGTRPARAFDTPDPDYHQPFILERRLIGVTEDDDMLGAESPSMEI